MNEKDPIIMERDRVAMLKHRCEKSFLFFIMMLFKEHNNLKFIPYPHIQKIVAVLEAVASGKLKRVIINIPPRYGKTEVVVKMFIPWGLALNKMARFIHLSYSADLALNNSATSKEYIQSEIFQKMWPMELKVDQQAKSNWFNTLGGGCYATSTGGPVTGFGAGMTIGRDEMEVDHPFKAFGGAIIIDDPNKPDDIFSDIKRNFINDRYNNTIRSRVNNRETPIIIIQQRLHETDLSGYLLSGGSGEKWYHLNLPALDENNKPLCEAKHTFEELEQMRQADRFAFSGQYMQNPSPAEGGIIRREWFNIIKRSQLPPINAWEMYIDGAYTKNTRNDPTGVQISAKHGGNLYILSSVDRHLEMPELIKFLSEHAKAMNVNIRLVLAEPKASGKSIVQLLRDQTNFNVAEVTGKILRESKEERASKSAPYIEGGRVFLVEGPWVDAYLHQMAIFPNGRHDEHVDLTAFSIDRNLLRRIGGGIIW